MPISDKVELLGKGLYKELPSGILTITAIPTSSELDYVSAEDFDEVMIKKILPKSVEEHMDFGNLLEIDYQWLLRCLRILNYGPYHTTNALYCPKCGTLRGDYRIDLQNVPCNPLPPDFKNRIILSRNEFIEYKGDIVLHLLTIKEYLNAKQDSQFKRDEGDINLGYARTCYMINSMGNQEHMSPIEVKLEIEKRMTPADYQILRQRIRDVTNYGLRAGGQTTCPQCGGKEAAFFAMVDERYFRPTLDDLRAWKVDRTRREDANAT